jgi:hypothetical protein
MKEGLSPICINKEIIRQLEGKESSILKETAIVQDR